MGLRRGPRHHRSSDIGVGKQQLVEIAKALAKDVKLLILDEPTAALNEGDSQHLLDLHAGPAAAAASPRIMISHKLNEIEQIADAITIIRDGKSIETLDVKDDGVDEDRIIRGMVGRDLESPLPGPRRRRSARCFFEVRDWTVRHPQRRRTALVVQERQLHRPPRRDRRLRRPDGRRPHRAGAQRLRPSYGT